MQQIDLRPINKVVCKCCHLIVKLRPPYGKQKGRKGIAVPASCPRCHLRHGESNTLDTWKIVHTSKWDCIVGDMT